MADDPPDKTNGSGQSWFLPALRTYREDCKLTQKRLAEISRQFDPEGRGVSKETISKVERRYAVKRRTGLVLFDAINSVHPKSLERDAELLNYHPGGESGLSAEQ